jgi:hypothetical protein
MHAVSRMLSVEGVGLKVTGCLEKDFQNVDGLQSAKRFRLKQVSTEGVVG